jgi:D-inositol-3-phosphate glycosyltransferase
MNLRICYLLPRLLPTPAGTVVGGSAANCVSLALELKRRGADIELLASVASADMAHLAGRPLADILRPLTSGGRGLLGKGLGTLHALRCGLKTRLREKQFDVVHAHSGTYPYAIVPLAADRRRCVRLHSLYCPLGAPGGVYSNWWEKTMAARLVFERLDRVIAVTENVHQSLENAGVRSQRMGLVRMCVDTERFYPKPPREPRRYFSGGSGVARLVFIGNASKEKGLLELLAAVRLLAQKRIPVFLVAAIENQCGIQEYAVQYESAKAYVRQAQMESHVRFVHLVDSIEDLYAESDLVVIPWNTSRGPSDYPMVALEAMAMGKCVVSTPVGGCPHLLEDGRAGFLTQGFSAQEIAGAIEAAVTNPADRASAEQIALKRIRESSLAASAEHFLTMYERLLAAKTRCCSKRRV